MPTITTFPPRLAGVDLGASLAKVVHGGPELRFALFPVGDQAALIAYLRDHGLTRLAVTGGSAGKCCDGLTDFEVQTADEFSSNVAGANYLLARQGGVAWPYALAVIGTGTSVYRVGRRDSGRATGTAVGGGTITGLGHVLTGERDYAQILALAGQGSRTQVDLLVSDIYGHGLPGLGGEITAANFGKALSDRPADLARGLLQLVGEVVAVVACLAGAKMAAKEVVYVGGSLLANPILAQVLDDTTHFMGQRPRFVAHGEHAGALGALLGVHAQL